MTKLPMILEREPLVDAVFEVRLGDTLPLADILPGFLLHEFGTSAKVTRLPAADIPRPLRADNPGLQFAPIQRLEWDRYLIAFGDSNIVISCKLPYPKWPSFKATILDIMAKVAKVELQGSVKRYSVKYVNLIQAPTFAEQVQKIRMEIKLGDVKVSDDHVSLQVHRAEGDIIHILSVVTGAQVNIPGGSTILGALVDVDSIREVSVSSFGEFVATLEPGLEALRQANKAKFFGCLTEATIKEMRPMYE